MLYVSEKYSPLEGCRLPTWEVSRQEAVSSLPNRWQIPSIFHFYLLLFMCLSALVIHSEISERLRSIISDCAGDHLKNGPNGGSHEPRNHLGWENSARRCRHCRRRSMCDCNPNRIDRQSQGGSSSDDAIGVREVEQFRARTGILDGM